MAETDVQKMQSGVAQSKKELGGLKKKIQEEKQKITEIHRKEASAISQLNNLDRTLSKNEKELKVWDQQLRAVTRKVQKATDDLEILNQTISSQEDFLESRLVALYKFGDEGVPKCFFLPTLTAIS